MSGMERMLDVIADLAGLRDVIPTYRWGTVAGLSPLRVTLDGPGETPLPYEPTLLVPGVRLGDRVRVRHLRNKHEVTGVKRAPVPPWVDLALTNGWLQSSAGAPAQAQITGGRIHLRGEVYAGDVGPGEPIATLPEWARPAYRLRVPWGHLLVGYVAIETTGEIWSDITRTSTPGLFLEAVPPFTPAGG